ncbi:MAG: serine/threonine-protein phosphatase [Phycisphaerales bacterium]|nr:serine/threonine-protein phosphatase [Planctomycetota bacterium]MCH8509194.1 serine/threonine-protein phosphatase [Phycisphaerales bacterium]
MPTETSSGTGPITRVGAGPAAAACGLRDRWVGALAALGLDARAVTLDETFRAGRPGVCVAVLSPDEPDAAVYQLADRAQESLVPGVVLLPPELERIGPMLGAEGLVVLGQDTEPEALVCILRALDARQAMVQKLRDELKIAQLSVNGAYGEMARLQEEMQTAASIQQAHMPRKIPTLNGVQVGVVYRPATYVSGDIYDIAQLDEHRSAFFIADAVGHGVPAALMTMIIACGLHKMDGVGPDARVVPPAEALFRLNNAMTEHTGGSSRFATAVYGVFDARTGEVTIAGAGHPPPIIVRQGGASIERIEPDGPLLGVFPDADFGQTTVRLDPGDLMILFSDGFEVAFPKAGSEGDDFKRPTLTYIEKLANAGDGGVPLAEAVAVLERELDGASGSLHQPDDITALFVAPTGAAVGA